MNIVPVTYSDGSSGSAADSKLLTREGVLKEFAREDCTFGTHSVVILLDGGELPEARKCRRSGRVYYDLTGIQLPGDGFTRLNIDSTNPEILERIRELLDDPFSPLPLDDQGQLHYVSVELLARDQDPWEIRTAWTFVPEAGDQRQLEVYVWVAVVVDSDGASGPRIYTSLTEAGMWRAVREGEPDLRTPEEDFDWLGENKQHITFGRQAVSR